MSKSGRAIKWKECGTDKWQGSHELQDDFIDFHYCSIISQDNMYFRCEMIKFAFFRQLFIAIQLISIWLYFYVTVLQHLFNNVWIVYIFSTSIHYDVCLIKCIIWSYNNKTDISHFILSYLRFLRRKSNWFE